MKSTVIQHTFLNFDQSKKNRFSTKTAEPQIKQKNPRSSEKNNSGNTDRDVTSSRSCDQGKITEKACNIIMDILLTSRATIKTVHFCLI